MHQAGTRTWARDGDTRRLPEWVRVPVYAGFEFVERGRRGTRGKDIRAFLVASRV